MTPETDMQFGDMSTSEPKVQRRPDENAHWSVAEAGRVAKADLPVFVDLDAWRQIESHAASDTSVELGGVLLGGQFIDRDNQPFVVIHDVLPAEHYVATRGSFKFTHETWSAITRRMAEFPAETRIVGWYHTHPDWGVFLSGLDLFICRSFFASPLDVAIVIDPCRNERGVFYWPGGGRDSPRRAEGFYLMASRWRSDEVLRYAQYLERGPAMSVQPAAPHHKATAPEVHITQPISPWIAFVWGSAWLMQFCFLAFLVWRVTLPPAETPRPADQDEARLARVFEQWTAEQRRGWEADAKLDVVDQWLAAHGEPAGIAGQLAEDRLKIQQLEASLEGLRIAYQQAEQQARNRAAELADVRDKAARREEQLRKQLETAQTELQQRTAQINALRAAAAENRSARTSEGKSSPSEHGGPTAYAAAWITAAGVGLGLAVMSFAYIILVLRRCRAREEPAFEPASSAAPHVET